VTDNELMLQVQDGDAAKLGILFERHHVKLYNFLVRLTSRRDLSEDLVQEVFLRILKYGQTFRGEGTFTVWMYQLARNAAADHFRKWKRESVADEMLQEHADEDPLPDEHVERGDATALLKAALARLPADKREVLILARYHELKYEEVGQILGCAVGTVKAKVHRALKELKKEFARLSREKL
jgi:RNA polymerase sigma factor (sigma-70 family)